MKITINKTFQVLYTDRTYEIKFLDILANGPPFDHADNETYAELLDIKDPEKIVSVSPLLVPITQEHFSIAARKYLHYINVVFQEPGGFCTSSQNIFVSSKPEDLYISQLFNAIVKFKDNTVENFTEVREFILNEFEHYRDGKKDTVYEFKSLHYSFPSVFRFQKSGNIFIEM